MSKQLIYVASKFENAPAVRDAYEKLRAAGHEIARDWTEAPRWDWENQAQVDERAPRTAMADLGGVLGADVFIFLTPTDPEMRQSMIGAYVEFGMALAVSFLDGLPRIFIVGDQPRNTFRYLSFVQVVDTIEEVIEELRDDS